MVKEKDESERTYDQDGFRRRAACLCVKDGTEREVIKLSVHLCQILGVHICQVL